ncbi:putative DNA modification/repair radical SAM protein [Neisseria wadsworthii]|uniref:putative DNA modification/repair radical SAM protein n=1 Tax=Neisseria wadsworthii TaxID=607711 RepID=UPI000D313DA1|nr:putative DNA modification/repair radical SAM protein [Neisseria wadsworthii]
MDYDKISKKLEILADAAKYDVSCSSSGSKRTNNGSGLGNASRAGICHSFTEDGRCVSLLKILLTNHCIYDCAYCVSRRSNDIARAAFTVDEVVDLTLSFYRRNYIEGLFLSSGIFKNADYTMERLVRIAKKLRLEHQFHGYIHLKTIPKASEEILHEAGLYADRLSINMEIPTISGLKLLAPEKNHHDMTRPMTFVRNEITALQETRKTIKSTPKFAPAGQSTQFIIGAAGENDRQIIRAAGQFYRNYRLKRVYYSGYVPVLEDKRLPPLSAQVPLRRENRLYQADWLMRFYGFNEHEILDDTQPFLDLDFDPKLAWALRHREWFPVPLQTAPLETILRVPGIGVKSAKRIVQARRFRVITLAQLAKMGIALNRARYFITLQEPNRYADLIDSPKLSCLLLQNIRSKFSQSDAQQGDLFG